MKKGLRDRITEGRPVLFLGIALFDSAVVEMAALAGCDGVVIDSCQTRWSPERVREMILAADSRGIYTIIRAANIEDAVSVLDYGADAVMFDQIESVDEAIKLVENCKYPPIGKRGMSARGRSKKYGLISANESIHFCNSQTLLIIQIETKIGLDNIDEILSVQGIDMVSSGRNDLALSLGVPGETSASIVIEAEKKICETSEKHNMLPVLMTASDRAEAEQLINNGMTVISIGNDTSFLLSSIKSKVQEIQKAYI